MRVVKPTDANMGKILSLSERILRSGGVIISPTDTVYGILGDANNPDTIKKIFAMKQRPQEKALPIFVKSIAEARKYAYISDAKAEFLEKVWLAPLETARPEGPSGAPARARFLTGPGPLTVVFQHKEKLPRVLTGGLGTIGIRIPNHPFLLKLLASIDFPLVQTSANVSGLPPVKSIIEVKRYFGKSNIKPDLVIDGGEIQGEQSMVIDFAQKEPIILRAGLVSKSELDRLFNSVR